MKIRNGFVSNSSSSSFLVVFDEMPKEVHDVYKVMFGPDGPENICIYDHSIPSFEAAKQVWKDIRDQQKALPYSEEFIYDEFANVVYNQMYREFTKERNSMYQMRGEERKKAAEELRNKENVFLDKAQKEISAEFSRQHEGKVILYFTYSDNGGSFHSVMEHGDIFDKLPHVRISHH